MVASAAEGLALGEVLGLEIDGDCEGDAEGGTDGLALGLVLGLALGLALGEVLGLAVGPRVGRFEGLTLGDTLGLRVGPTVASLGLEVGSVVLEQLRVIVKAKLVSPTALAGKPYAPSSSPLPSDAATLTSRVTLSAAVVAVAQRKVSENACDAPPTISPDAGGPAMSQSLSVGDTVAVNVSGAAPTLLSNTGATVRSFGNVTE